MKRLTDILNYTFQREELLNIALTHPSMKHPSVVNESLENNQRLEFLGDAVLGMVVAEYLYFHHSDFEEGKLTKIRSDVVCEVTLADVADGLDLGRFLVLSKGEEHTGGRHRKSNLADLFEAIVAAIYIDGGYKEAKKFILTQLKGKLELAAAGKLIVDYKTRLQELVQVNKNAEILYQLDAKTGPDHHSSFDVSVYVNGKLLGSGSGPSKKIAEQNAAKLALLKLEAAGETQKN